jgi:hypothetical protein
MKKNIQRRFLGKGILGNARINVTLRRVLATAVAMEKQ